MLIYHVKANRFLRNMVRAMVGTLLDIGKGKLDAAGLSEILNKGSRSDAGESAPAKGLFLEQVDYPSGLFSDAL
jgi:tRNA pseudouridine38-40 synthase